MVQTTIKISFILLLSILLAACGGNAEPELPTQMVVPTSTDTPIPVESPTPTLTPLPTVEFIIPQTSAQTISEQAYVRVINASPNLGILDVYIESLAIATNMDYKTYTERSGIVAGSYTVRIVTTGALLGGEPLYQQDIDIAGGSSLIFLITGTPDAVDMTVLNENVDPLQANTSHVSLLNAVMGANTLVMLANDAPLTPTISFLSVSGAVEFNPSVTEFKFLNEGILLVQQAFELRARENYTLLVIGDITRPETVEVIAFSNRAPGLTQINVVNASPSIGGVNVYLGKDIFLGTTAFTEVSVPMTVLSGSYDINLYESNADINQVEPLAATQFLANPDEDVTIIIMGEPNNLRFVTYRNNLKPTYDDKARMTFVNGLESAQNVLMQTNYDLTVQLSYGQVSDAYDIDLRSTNFNWVRQMRDSQDVSLENFSNFVPEPGFNYLYVFAGRAYERPILVSYPVGTLGFSSQEAIQPTVAPARPARMHFVSLMQNRSITIRVDGTVIAENMNDQDSTGWLITTEGAHTITIHDSQSDDLIDSTENDYQIAHDYTIVIYDGTSKFLILDDSNVVTDKASGFVRVINLSLNDNSLFGMGYSPSDPNVSQPDSSENYRRSLPLGVLQAARDTAPQSASLVSRIPAGMHNIRVIDNDEAAIAYTFPEVNIEAGTLYDIYVEEVLDHNQVRPSIIPYPPR